MSKLLLFVEPNKAKQVALDAVETTIGRAPENHIVVNQARVSRQHAVIVAEGGAFTIRDLESRNGILVNGTPVRSHKLRHGDEIMVGDCKMRFFATQKDFASDETLRLLTVPGSLPELDRLRR